MARRELAITDAKAIEKFESLSFPEPNSGCWIWMGAGNYEYGLLNYAGRRLLAHRASFLIHHGELAADRVVMHSCDNKICVNPDHLSAGTNQENVVDFFNKKAAGDIFLQNKSPARKFARSAHRRLSDGEVAAIATCSASSRRIAAVVGVHHTLISQIKRGVAYCIDSDVPPDPSLVERLSAVPPPSNVVDETGRLRRREARQLRSQGRTYKQIAETMGISETRAYQLAALSPSPSR